MAANPRVNAQEETFEEQLRMYCEHSSNIHKQRFKWFEAREAKVIAAKEKARKDRVAKRKAITKWKKLWANKKQKLVKDEKEESSDDDFYYDYDNLHLAYEDVEKSPKFHL